MAIINFSEQQHSVLFYDIRVFIFGCEVTPWVTGTVNITHADRYGPSQAQFSLSNPMQAFELTYENIGALSYEKRISINQSIAELQKELLTAESKEEKQAISSKISEYQKAINYSMTVDGSNGSWRMADQPINYSFQSGNYGDLIYSERAKKEIFDKKRLLNFDSKGNYLIDPLTNQPRYPLNPKSLIIQKHDTVRIFFLNPLKEPKRNDTETQQVFDEQWMYGFTGFVDTAIKNDNGITDESTINVSCKCIKGMTQLMRFQTNVLSEKFDPGTLGLENFQDNVGFFADLRINSPIGASHPLSNMSLEESVSILVTGQGSNINENIVASERGYRDSDIPDTVKGAVGKFTLGNVYFFNGLDKSSLKGRSNLSNRGKNSFDTGRDLLQDWYDLCLFGTNRDFLTREDVDAIGRNSGPYESQSPWNQQLFMLLPGEGTGLQNVTQYSVGTISDSREWDTRFNLLLEITGNLDYQLWTSPAGDLMLEFPMMDFYPEDFGQYKSILEYDKHFIDAEVGDEAGEIISFLTCTGNYVFEPINQAIQAAPVIPRITIQSDMLAIRFGVIGGEPKNFPFLLEGYENYQPGGPYDFRLARLGLIEFQKRMSEFNTFSFNASFRPFLLPNKPVYVAPKERMATTTGISLSFDMSNYSASSNTAVRYVRTLMPDGTFTLITGADTMPISYRSLYNSNETFKLDKGLYVRFDDSDSKKSIKQ